MIIVGGTPRCGSSVMVECLKNSGFYIGNEKDLDGHKYKSEYIPFKDLNKKITRTRWQDLAKNGYITTYYPQDFEYANEIFETVKKEGIEVLKCNFVGWLMNFWVSYYPDAKYIVMERDSVGRAKSMRRLQSYHGREPNGLRKTIRDLDSLNRAWQIMTENLNRIMVDYDKFINKEETGKISEFIGREFDDSIISKKETYNYSGMVH